MRLQGSNVFAGKHGFITPRDLFRWAGRGAVGYQQVRSGSTLCRLGQHAVADMQPKLASRPCCIVCCPAAEISLPPMQLAEDGYAVLAERLREPAERAMVADVLQKILNAQVPPRPDTCTAALPNAQVQNVCMSRSACHLHRLASCCCAHCTSLGALPFMSMCGKAFIDYKSIDPDDESLSVCTLDCNCPTHYTAVLWPATSN